jgi:hypothetical protein
VVAPIWRWAQKAVMVSDMTTLVEVIRQRRALMSRHCLLPLR